MQDAILTLGMIEEAREQVSAVAHETPVLTARALSPRLFLKAENLQRTGSFKVRGAYNKICHLSEAERRAGVIACSAGNHAQGVALAASTYGIRSVVCMPKGAPVLKVNATKGYGAEVVLVPGEYDDAETRARWPGMPAGSAGARGNRSPAWWSAMAPR